MAMVLAEKPEIVALNKMDAIPKPALAKKRAALEKASGGKVYLISGVSRRGRQTTCCAPWRGDQRAPAGARRRGAGRAVRACARARQPRRPPIGEFQGPGGARSPELRESEFSRKAASTAPQPPQPRKTHACGAKARTAQTTKRQGQARQESASGKAKAKLKGKARPRARRKSGWQMSDLFSGAKLIVVKVGSALLVDGASGELRRDWLASLCADVAALKQRGQAGDSGVVRRHRAGPPRSGLKPGALRLEESQAAAAAGQVRLAEAYADSFAGPEIVAAQVLLTLGDTEERAAISMPAPPSIPCWNWAPCR